MNDAGEEFVLIDDDSGNWYVCPAGKQAEVSKYFDDCDRYWLDLTAAEKTKPPREPDYLVKVGGAPSLVKFTGFRIE